LPAARAAAAIERVDQSSSFELASVEMQLALLDTFAHLTEEAQNYRASLAEQRSQETKIQEFMQYKHLRERELEWALKDLALIEEIGWQLGEEEKLTQEHHLLSHAQELQEKTGTIAFTLTEGAPSIKQTLSQLEGCLRFDPQLQPLAQSLKNALLELEEVGRTLHSYGARVEADPKRLEAVEKRLASLESLKRRFGPDIALEKKKLQDKVGQNDPAEIETLRAHLDVLQKKNEAWGDALVKKRKEASVPFATQILAELKELNLPHAQFVVTDDFRFLFSANPGLSPLPLEQCASGGELSRLLLAMKIVLAAGKSSLVFDEIDSNVGGHTAAILGKKLHQLAQKRQVICVTHFVQVAKWATDHFLVAKREKEGQAVTVVTKMDEKEKEREYNRMLGQK
jgi:DNA repair protein RecN (Recombination protein N)